MDLWFDPADFVAPPPNTYGDVGPRRAVFAGPREFRHVAVQARSCSSGERTRVPVEAFNLFNHPGFGFPNAAIGIADGRPHHDDGRWTTGSMQFAFKFDF